MTGPSDSFGAMTLRAHVFVAVAALLVLVFIIRLVRRHGLRTKYSLLWITVGVALLALALFPKLLNVASELLGIYYPPATLLLFAVGFLFLVVVHFSWEQSRSEERIRVLAEELALLRERTERGEDEGRSEDTASADDAAPAVTSGPAGHHDQPVGGERPPETAEQPLGGQ